MFSANQNAEIVACILLDEEQPILLTPMIVFLPGDNDQERTAERRGPISAPS